jgi:MFS family permease
MAERALIIGVVIIFWVSLYIFVPILSPYAAAMGAGLDLIGLIVGSYGLSQLLLRIPIGWLSDRLGRRRPFVVAGFAFTAASCLLMALAPTAWHLVGGRALSGVAATMWVPLSVLLAAAFPPDRAILAMGVANFATNIGQIIGTMGGGWAAQQWGWNAPFFASAAVAVAGLLLTLALVERSAAGRSQFTLQAAAAVVSSRSLLTVAGLGALVQYITYVTVFGFTPLYAAEIGASRTALGWLTVATTVPGALAALMADAAARRLGVRASLAGGFLLAAAMTAVIPFTGALPVLFVTQALGGFGKGLVFPLLMGLSIQAVPAGRRAMAMGAFQSIYALGMFGGPVIAGAIGRATSVHGLFLTTAAVGLLAAACTRYVRQGTE